MKAIGLILIGVVIGVLLVAGVMAYMVIHDKQTQRRPLILTLCANTLMLFWPVMAKRIPIGEGNFIKSWIHEFIDSLNNIFILPPY